MDTDDLLDWRSAGSQWAGDSQRLDTPEGHRLLGRADGEHFGKAPSLWPQADEAVLAAQWDDSFGVDGASHDLPATVPLEVQLRADASAPYFSEERKCSRSGSLVNLDKAQQIIDESIFFETAVPTMSNAGQITRINSITCHGDL